MKISKVATAGLVLTLSLSSPALAQTGHDLFQQALVKEQAEGDLRAAITLYERIVQEFAGDRPLAANALVQMGQCYERLGSEEAERAYQKVLEDYADQTEIVTRARARLAALREPPARADESTIVLRQLPSNDAFMDGGPLRSGRAFALIDYSTGDVALQDLVSGETRRLTHEGSWESPTRYAINVQPSPDGSSAAYTWSRETDSGNVIELRVVGMDGSAPRTLISNTDEVGYPMSWTNDGRHIAVWVYDSQDKTGGIAWVSLEDGSMRRLATFPGWEWASLSHSPDDRFVVAEYPVEEDSGRYDLFLVATGGGGTTPLVDHPANDRLLGWLPQTDYVLFLSDRSGDWDLWGIRVGDDGVPDEPVALKRGVGNIESLGFTDDGSLVFYLYIIRQAAFLAPFNAATGQIDMAAGEPLLGSVARPAWSPDGRYLALVRQETGPGGPGWLESSVVLRDLATGVERALAPQLDPIVPHWFPDGSSILVAASERERPATTGRRLYRIDVGTGEAFPLLESEPDPLGMVGGAPTGDGNGFVYALHGRLVLRDGSEGRETVLREESGLATNLLAVSPDGAEVVFAVNDQPTDGRGVLVGNGRFMAVSLSGGEARELAKVQGPGTVYCVQWAPDGSFLLFLQLLSDQGTALWRVPREGGDPERVWQTGERVLWFAPSPDATQVVYTTHEGAFEVWVMENLIEALQEQEGR